MTGKVRTSTKGKENVKCKECDKIIRKDEMTKHWNNKHKHLGGQSMCKHIATGTADIHKYFPKKDKIEDSEWTLVSYDSKGNVADKVSPDII